MADMTPNPLAKDLVDSSGKTKPFVVLAGYLWMASEKDPTVRLYTGLEFNAYYEIQVGDILHTARPDLQYEEVPAKVYVAAGAKVRLVQSAATAAARPVGRAASGGEAAYLKGGISSAHLADAMRTFSEGLEGLCKLLGSVVHCNPTTGPTC
jgi:hypothetical protein